METVRVHWRKVALYNVFAFGISWTLALAAYVWGVSITSVPGIMVLAIGYMPAPAIAAWLVQKKIFRQPLSGYGVRVRGTRVRGILWSILLVWVLVCGTLGLVAVFGNVAGWSAAGRVTFEAQEVARRAAALAPAGDSRSVAFPDLAPPVLFALLLIGGTLSGAVVNSAFAFGEELGWRGLLQTELAPLGRLRSNLLIGAIWGVWHVPVILQGHNYPGHAWTGALTMIVFTTAASFALSWSREMTRSIVGPSVLHGVLNAVGTLPALFVVGAHPLIGTTPGLFGCGILALSAVVVLRTRVRHFPQPVEASTCDWPVTS